MARSHKYHAKPCMADGYRFDSRAEMARYFDLLLLQAGQKISNLMVHPVYVLQEGFRTPAGQAIRAMSYEADFFYIEGDLQVVEDVKGHETEAWRIKRKLFLWRYPELDLRIIKLRSLRR